MVAAKREKAQMHHIIKKELVSASLSHSVIYLSIVRHGKSACAIDLSLQARIYGQHYLTVPFLG